MQKEITYVKNSSKSFDETIASLEKNVADNMFRVLHTHDVTATLAEKEFTINPLRIMEICNAGFAFKALGIEPLVALFNNHLLFTKPTFLSITVASHAD